MTEKDLIEVGWRDLVDKFEKALQELQKRMKEEEFALFLDSVYKIIQS